MDVAWSLAQERLEREEAPAELAVSEPSPLVGVLRDPFGAERRAPGASVVRALALA